MKKTEWVPCPHCGEEIRRDAKACRHCGSDDSTGWSEDTYMDGIDLPGEDDYGDGLEEEGFRKAPMTPGRMALASVAVALVSIFALWLLRAIWS